MALPSWIEPTAPEVRSDSRLQPHQLQAGGSYDEDALEAEIARRAPIQAGVVWQRVQGALAALTPAQKDDFEYSNQQQTAIQEVVKLKVIAAILGSIPDEQFIAPAKNALREAEEILRSLEIELQGAAQIVVGGLANIGNVGTVAVRSPLATASDERLMGLYPRLDDPYLRGA